MSRALPKPEAPRTLMMRDRGSRALPATPTGQPTRRHGRAAKPCSPCAAIRMPSLPLPYKYHPTPARTEQEREKRENGEKRKKRTKGKGTERKKEIKRGSWKQGRGTVRDKGEGL